MKLKHKQRGFIESLISGAFSFLGGERRNKAEASNAREANEWSSREAKVNRDWNAIEAARDRNWKSGEAERVREYMERMSNTSHQREIKDLEAAGLNPILSARGGASSPSASPPSGSPASSSAMPNIRQPQIENSLGNAVSSALATRKLKADVEYAEAQTYKAEKEAGLTSEKTETEKANRIQVRATTRKIISEISEIKARTSLHEVKTRESIINNFIQEFVTLPKGQIDVAKARMLKKQLQMEMEVYAGPRGKMYKELEVANKGSSAAGLASGAVAGLSVAGVKTMKGVISKLDKIIKSKKIDPLKY